MAEFSKSPAVRVAVRVQEGRIVAASFAEDGHQTESALDFGPVTGVDLEAVFARIRFVFDGLEIAG